MNREELQLQLEDYIAERNHPATLTSRKNILWGLIKGLEAQLGEDDHPYENDDHLDHLDHLGSKNGKKPSEDSQGTKDDQKFVVKESLKTTKIEDDQGDQDSPRIGEDDHLEIEDDQDDQDDQGFREDDHLEITWGELFEEIEDVEWLWEGWLAKGFPHIIFGAPGIGKSYLLLYLVGCVTNNFPLPDGSSLDLDGKVLWVETEAAQPLNKKRASLLKLDTSRIISPRKKDISFDDPEDRLVIEQLAKRDDVSMIIIDSLSAGTTRDATRSSDMQELMGWFASLARDVYKPILITHHPRKTAANAYKKDKLSLDDMRDSSVIAQRARIIWAVDAPNPDDESAKRLYHIKNNLSTFPDDIGYQIDNGIIFTEAPASPVVVSKTEEALDVVRHALKDGKKSATELEELVIKEGVARPTYIRARDKLKRAGEISNAKTEKGWMWFLLYKEPLCT